MFSCNFLLVLASSILFVHADHWGYPAEQANGVVRGEEKWGGQCSIGRRQSPIDLTIDASVAGRFPPLLFKNYEGLLKNAKIRNTGHSLQIDIPKDQEYLLTGGGLPGVYVMDQMHFHWASEHTIHEERFGLELHIVSHERRFANFSTAVENKKGVAVLGVLFHVSDRINPVLKNLLDSAEPVKDGVGNATDIKTAFAPLELLPAHRDSYFRYEGSLTTPTCDEAVIWTVLTESIPFAISQIERFKETKDGEGEYLTHNFRQLQRLNSRPLVYVHDENRQNHSAAIGLTVSAVVFSVAFCLQLMRVFY